VKVGVKGYDDAVSVGRLRRVMGPTFDIRIDANEAWRCDTLERKTRARFLPLGITGRRTAGAACRRGWPGSDPAAAECPDHGSTNRCAAWRTDGGRIERGTCELFNIRLSKCGGFINSLKLGRDVAHGAGLGYQPRLPGGGDGDFVGRRAAFCMFGRGDPLSGGEFRQVPGGASG